MKSNDELRSDVELELDWEPKLDENHISVGVKDGAVTLIGHVPTFMQKLSAVRAAERVYGVKAVADELEIRLEGSHVRDDSDIAEAVAHILTWNATVPKDVKAEVADGTVTLKGTTDWEFQRDEAGRSVRGVIGVQGVRNLIELKARPAVAQAVERGIASAYGRQASLDARRIHVTVHDSTAVLSGHVHSLAELRSARKAAYAAPGITKVESHLTVEP
jgi:osmotically-inducible protein OsmY